jgi:hypothetical protein
MTVPSRLAGAAMEPAPDAFQAFATRHGVRATYFVDDRERCTSSLRDGDEIYINTRGSGWAAYIASPLHAASVPETIVLRFLHEVGHVHLKHPGNHLLAALGLARPGPFEGHEGEAWQFALEVRNHKDDYRRLLAAATEWYGAHLFAAKDWEESPAGELEYAPRF